jgi:hypothetical protein
MRARLAIVLFVTLFLTLGSFNAFAGIDDLDDPGVPETKTDYTEGLSRAQGNPDHFDYDTHDYHVTERMLHRTLVSVAVHRDAMTAESPSPEAFAELIIDYFHHAWHVFGGYKYDRFGVKIRKPAAGTGFSLSPVGVSFHSARNIPLLAWQAYPPRALWTALSARNLGH